MHVNRLDKWEKLSVTVQPQVENITKSLSCPIKWPIEIPHNRCSAHCQCSSNPVAKTQGDFYFVTFWPYTLEFWLWLRSSILPEGWYQRERISLKVDVLERVDLANYTGEKFRHRTSIIYEVQAMQFCLSLQIWSKIKGRSHTFIYKQTLQYKIGNFHHIFGL